MILGTSSFGRPRYFEILPHRSFAYWLPASLRNHFRSLPPFENTERIVRVGLQTSDDFRFVRAWWEVPTEDLCPPEKHPKTFEGTYCVTGDHTWFPFAKGGKYSPSTTQRSLALLIGKRMGWNLKYGPTLSITRATGRGLSRMSNTIFGLVFRARRHITVRTCASHSPRDRYLVIQGQHVHCLSRNYQLRLQDTAPMSMMIFSLYSMDKEFRHSRIAKHMRLD